MAEEFNRDEDFMKWLTAYFANAGGWESEYSGNIKAMHDAWLAGRSGWKCFHCDKVFTDQKIAEEHFGVAEHSIAKCLTDRIAGRDRVSEELANWHAHKEALISVLISFVRDNPKWMLYDREQDPCGAHELLAWIENETWMGFNYPAFAAEAVAVSRDTPTKRLSHEHHH